MDPRGSEPTNRTKVERKSECELVITRTFNGPARIVFEAWTKPELIKLWWAPKSVGVVLLSCEADVRVGGRYRFEIGHEGSKPMAFFGRYIEVTASSNGCSAPTGIGVSSISRATCPRSTRRSGLPSTA